MRRSLARIADVLAATLQRKYTRAIPGIGLVISMADFGWNRAAAAQARILIILPPRALFSP